MTPQEAFNILRQIGAQFQGNLKDHQDIQDALKIFEDLIKSQEPKQEKPTK